MRRIIAISGPSGVGKTTLVEALTKNLCNVIVAKSITTRPPREGEGDDLQYVHLPSETDFLIYRQLGRLLEWKRHPYNGHLYGTLDPEVDPAELEEDRKFLIFNVDRQGEKALRKKYADSGLYVAIYLLAPYETLKKRMEDRGEAPEAIEARLKHASDHIGELFGYDFIIMGDEPIREMVKKVQHIIFDPDGVRPLPPRNIFERALESFPRETE